MKYIPIETLTDKQKNALIYGYVEDWKSTEKLEEAFGVSRYKIRKFLKSKGVLRKALDQRNKPKTHRPRTPKHTHPEIIRDYQLGVACV